MSRPRGEPSRGLIDREFPHQVALPIDRCTGPAYGPPQDFCRGRSLYHLTPSVSDGDRRYLLFCFQTENDAAMFKQAFDGISLFPEDRVGQRWKRPPGDVRRAEKVDPYRWPER